MPPKSAIRLLIVDDHSMVRMGLVTILGVEKDLKIVAEAEDAEQAVARFRQYQPDVTLMDSRCRGAAALKLSSVSGRNSRRRGSSCLQPLTWRKWSSLRLKQARPVIFLNQSSELN
jgi:DNA-binding NarL/FixJ family response regulator